MAKERLSPKQHEKEAPPTVKVKLLKPHEHEGRRYDKGKVIEVRQDQAQRLKAWGVAEMLD